MMKITVRTLYKNLLALYPRSFRERFAESMEQTFNDLCNEQKRTDRSLFVFALEMFIETGIGIVKEHMLRIGQENKMKTISKDIGSAAIISFIIVLPLAILEALNNSVTRENAFGLMLLFGLMWLLPTAFIVIFISMLRSVRAGNTLMAKPMILLFRVASLVLIATVWGWGLIDQLPCFLGVPNCD